MPFPGLSRRRTYSAPAATLYAAAVLQSRRPVFFRDLGVPDTVDGRFEMVALHVFLALRRLKAMGDAGAPLAQALVDTLFADMDQSLREMGAGDLGVGRRVKAMAKSFYGRVAAYERGLAGQEGDLEAALGRNLFGTAAPDPASLAVIAGYLRREVGNLDRQPDAALLGGEISFGEVEAA